MADETGSLFPKYYAKIGRTYISGSKPSHAQTKFKSPDMFAGLPISNNTLFVFGIVPLSVTEA